MLADTRDFLRISQMWSNDMAIVHVITPIFILVFVFLIISSMTNAVEESEALLKLKSSISNSGALDSWKQGTKACEKNDQWDGVVCYKGIIYGLQLEKMNLSGSIDIDALTNVPGLRSISFMSNSFSGPIPEFNRLGPLRALFLSGNHFSGEIPGDYFANMKSLKKVWLSENNFTGEIPGSLAQVPNLMELRLEKNQFSGEIPGFQQASLVLLDLSDNNLEGEIPPSLLKFNTSSFEGNAGLCGEKINKPCEQSNGNDVPKDNGNVNDRPQENGHDERTKRISIWIMTASAVMFLLVIAGIFVLWRRQKKFDVMEKVNFDEEHVASTTTTTTTTKKDIELRKNSKGSSRRGSRGVGDLVMVNDEKGEFGLPDLMKAAAEVLGNGAMGSSYKAMMSDGFTVVVKRIREMNNLGKDAFDAEVRCLGRLKHRNILPPLAYHYRKEEKLFVHEYMPKGSLLYILHGDQGVSNAELSWPIRLKVVQGIARGLGFLHTELAHLDLPHGDLKSSNVLLSPDYEPLLTDYGFSSLVSSNQAAQSLIAYKCPEALQYQQVSPKCDVYCLGVIILEILTGKFPSHYLNSGNGGIDIVQWVRSAISEGREFDLFDSYIANMNSFRGEMEQLLHIGAACTETSPEQRLDIRESIRRIEGVCADGGQEDKKLQGLPTLRDGYAESPALQSQVSYGQKY